MKKKAKKPKIEDLGKEITNEAIVEDASKTKAPNPQSVKWLITINNPLDEDKGFDHDIIKLKLESLKSTIYYCMSDEISTTGTPHTHIYVAFRTNVRFSTLQRLFNSQATLHRAHGTPQQLKDYVGKTGKWEGTEKAKTSLRGTFEEWGELPKELISMGSREALILSRIQDGATNAEILREFPDYLRGMRDVEFVRQTLRHEENRNKWRTLRITYIFGGTGLGKTRSVMDGYGYSNVYAVNDYKHPFDGYAGENVLLFDEFDSGIKLQFMNNYMDGFPISLPARFSNKQACYRKVFIISNLPLTVQYAHEQHAIPEVWKAFLRRIQQVVEFMPDGTRRLYKTMDYFNAPGEFEEIPANTPIPFDDTDDTDDTPIPSDDAPPTPKLTQATLSDSDTKINTDTMKKIIRAIKPPQKLKRKGRKR